MSMLLMNLCLCLVAAAQASGGELMRSGVTHLRSGEVDAANADFDKLLEADPQSRPYLWQRGISLYLSGKYREGQQQFESHRTVNPHDVENATWHFLCIAARDGVEQARKSILPAPGDSRVPMEELYALYKGSGSHEAVEAAVAELPEGSPGRRSARFYADLYLGLLAHAEKKPEEATRYLTAAAATEDKNVMADVARVCFKRLVEKNGSR